MFKYTQLPDAFCNNSKVKIKEEYKILGKIGTGMVSRIKKVRHR